jgi:hypothetical protein
MRPLPHILPNAARVAVMTLLALLCGCQSAAIRVVDSDTGRPVAGAEIEHGYGKDPGLLAVLTSPATRKYIALETLTADADGRAVIRDVRTGHYLFVTAPAYARTEAYYESSGWRLLVDRPELRDGNVVLPLRRTAPCTQRDATPDRSPERGVGLNEASISK